MQDSGSLAMFKVTARDQGHHKGPLGAFVTYCNISCFFFLFFFFKKKTGSVFVFNTSENVRLVFQDVSLSNWVKNKITDYYHQTHLL